MSATQQRDNSYEIQLRSALQKGGLRFRTHRQLIPGLRRTVDVVLAKSRLAIFLDGCFWHGCPEHGTWPKTNSEWWRSKIEANIRRDRDTDARLCALSWRVLRVWEHELPEQAAERIAALAAVRDVEV
jgi:DNA mismatch endonuclease, patch repair protein